MRARIDSKARNTLTYPTCQWIKELQAIDRVIK